MSMREIFYNLGKHDASMLRSEAANLSGTEIIRREMSVPAFDPEKDYSEWAACSPVSDEGQVWTLIQPHNASHYEGRPSTLRALWGLCHTKDAIRAKAWVAPYGTSGLYRTGECYKKPDGQVMRLKEGYDNMVYDADAYAEAWEIVA